MDEISVSAEYLLILTELDKEPGVNFPPSVNFNYPVPQADLFFEFLSKLVKYLILDTLRNIITKETPHLSSIDLKTSQYIISETKYYNRKYTMVKEMFKLNIKLLFKLI